MEEGVKWVGMMGRKKWGLVRGEGTYIVQPAAVRSDFLSQPPEIGLQENGKSMQVGLQDPEIAGFKRF